MEYVNRLVLQGFEEYRRIRNLIINGTIFRIYNEDSLSPIQVSFTLNRDNPKTIYAKEDFAKVADRMMGFENYSAAFALGYVDEETIHISARSGDRVNVGIIMEAMSGGGTPKRAGTTVKSNNILEVEEELINKVALGISSEETLQEHPIVVKMKKM